MPIPRHIDELIRQRFEQLTEEGQQLIVVAQNDTRKSSPSTIPVGLTRGQIILSGTGFEELKTKFLSLLHILSGSIYITSVMDSVRELNNTPSGVDSLVGKINGLKNDYETGMFINLVEEIEAEITADYFGQAEKLLDEGQSGKYDHVPAAVLLGATLEDALRRLCARQVPPINILKENGSPKTMNSLIDDLKKADLYNELRAKQLRAWADIRNKAAHGEFDEFNRNDVEQMIQGVGNFLAEYL
jgi:hypothetical protein